jgi:hypothetical protein
MKKRSPRFSPTDPRKAISNLFMMIRQTSSGSRFTEATAISKGQDGRQEKPGRKKTASALVEKEYLIETEQMPEVFHECLAIALSHDSVVIRNVNIREITVEVIETENYAPDWDGDVQFH